MQSSFNILSGYYQVINPVIKNIITGKVIVGTEAMKDQRENITLNLLTNPIDYVQDGIVNVNIHVLGIENGQPNNARMETIVNEVLPLLNDKNYYFDVEGITLHLEIEDDKGVYEDQENKGKHFYNIRSRFITF